MAAYVIGDIEVTEPAAFQEYRNRVGATVEHYGGRFVVRGGRVNLKEGDWKPRLLVMLEFPALSRPSAGTTLTAAGVTLSCRAEGFSCAEAKHLRCRTQTSFA
jgi:uncharacterized protein (DUF1330 family)